MKLDFSVPSLFLADLKIGTPIIAHAREFGDRKFTGEIASLDSQIDPVTRTIVVRALIPNDDHLLKPGLLMSVELFSNARRSIVIPEESLIPEGHDNYVFIVGGDGKIEKRKIATGTRQPGTVEISSGLKNGTSAPFFFPISEISSGLNEGEKIVTHGTMTARPSQTANIIGEQTDGQSISDVLGRTATKGEAKDKD
jgi:membrane fusion protein (multidrug efflux system)